MESWIVWKKHCALWVHEQMMDLIKYDAVLKLKLQMLWYHFFFLPYTTDTIHIFKTWTNTALVNGALPESNFFISLKTAVASGSTVHNPTYSDWLVPIVFVGLGWLITAGSDWGKTNCFWANKWRGIGSSTQNQPLTFWVLPTSLVNIT